MPRVRSKSAGGGGGGLFATGIYTGDGNATQAIVGVGFNPRFVIIYAHFDSVDTPSLKADVDGVLTKIWRGIGAVWDYFSDMVISLDADGFTVGDGTGSPGTDNRLNVLGVDYTYICWG